jgi:hypothetical protein
MVDSNFEVPEIIKYAVKGLDNPTRWKIVEYLISNESVSYSNLLKGIDIKRKGSLTFHLDMLSKSAILERRENFGEQAEERVFYNISQLGKEIINGLLSALVPNTTTEHSESETGSTTMQQRTSITTTGGPTSPSLLQQMLVTAATS